MTSEEKKEECPKCGSTFMYLGNRLRHEQTCSGEFNQKCPLCFNHFKTKYSLTYHIKSCIARQELALKTKNASTPDEKLDSVKGMKKWKYCFFDSCYCSFNKFVALITHIFLCHSNTHKYGIQMMEFENMEEFEAWKEEETGNRYVMKSKKNNSCTLVCNNQESIRDDLLNKLDNRLVKGILEKKLCTSRILLTPYKGKLICTYLNFHTHNLKLEDMNVTDDKELYNKLKSYICLGVEMDDIYKQLILLTGCSDMPAFNKLYSEVKQVLSSIKERILGDKLDKQIDTDESDDYEEVENVIEVKSEGLEEIQFEIPMQVEENVLEENYTIVEKAGEDVEVTQYEVTIKSGSNVYNEHLYCQAPNEIELEIQENVTPELLQQLPVVEESIEIVPPPPKLPSKYKIQKGEIKSFSIKKKKTEQTVMKNVFTSTVTEAEGTALLDTQQSDVFTAQEERIKSFLLERKKVEEELVKKIFSKKGNNIIEEALKISNIIPENNPELEPIAHTLKSEIQVASQDKQGASTNGIEDKAKKIQAKVIERDLLPSQIPSKEKIEIIKKNMSIIEKYLDNPLIGEEEVYFIDITIDDILKKCEIESVKPDLSKALLYNDPTKEILQYINYTNLRHIVLSLNNNRIELPLVDIFTILTLTTSELVIDELKKAKDDFARCSLTPNVIDAFFYRLSQDKRDTRGMILASSEISELLETCSDVTKSPALAEIFNEDNLKKKTHLFLPYYYKKKHWILLVFHLEFHFYGILNPDKSLNIKECPGIRTVVTSVKRILPKSSWRNMEYIRVYQINKLDSGVYVCYYLERLMKKLPLITNINTPMYRLYIFDVIRYCCMGQKQFDHKKCALCKLHIISKNDKVSCKECKVSFHINCVTTTDKDFTCPNYQ